VAAHLARSAPSPAALPSFLRRPSLLWFHAALGLDVDAALDLVAAAGGAAAAAAAAGGASAPLLAAAWLCYLSLVSVGQTILSFQWRAARPRPRAPRRAAGPASARLPWERPCMAPCSSALSRPGSRVAAGGRLAAPPREHAKQAAICKGPSAVTAVPASADACWRQMYPQPSTGCPSGACLAAHGGRRTVDLPGHSRLWAGGPAAARSAPAAPGGARAGWM